MKPIWHRSYPPGVPPRLDLDPAATAASLLEESAARHPEASAFHHRGRTLSYRQVDQASGRFRSFLRERLALQPWASSSSG